MRYITNKPKLNKFEGNVDASYGITAHGDPNTAINAALFARPTPAPQPAAAR